VPLKDEHETHDILFQDNENMPKNKKGTFIASLIAAKLTHLEKKFNEIIYCVAYS
jgi:hypothetical protein